jgi:hypothetical protein
VKVTVTVQLADAARLAPQVLLEIRKSPALVPEIPMLPIEIAELPMLFRVTVFGVPDEPRATLPQARLLGEMRTPSTRQPVKPRRLRKRIAQRSRLPAGSRPVVRGCGALRVVVTCAGCIVLAGEPVSPRMKAIKQRNRKPMPTKGIVPIVLRSRISFRRKFGDVSTGAWMQKQRFQVGSSYGG